MVLGFRINDYCVYRTHGVAKVIDIRRIKVGDFESKCFVLYFNKEQLTLSVPVKYKDNQDIRRISTEAEMDKAFNILKTGPKKLKGMWSRRVQEYEEKINTGDILLIAEVLQDLIRDVDDADRSYSERIIYETAKYRLASEYAVIKKIPYEEAERYILDLAKEKIGFVDMSGNATAARA